MKDAELNRILTASQARFSTGSGRFRLISLRSGLTPYAEASSLRRGPITGSGRYSSATDTKCADKVRIWYQMDLVTA